MIAAREWSWGEEDFEVEPGESDALHADFIIPSDVKTVQLYAFVKNPRKNKEGLGWTTAELTSFDRGKGEGSTIVQKQRASPFCRHTGL